GGSVPATVPGLPPSRHALSDASRAFRAISSEGGAPRPFPHPPAARRRSEQETSASRAGFLGRSMITHLISELRRGAPRLRPSRGIAARLLPIDGFPL